MAKKPLKDILSGVKSSKVDPGSTGKDPGKDYKPKSGDEQKFVDKHATEKHDDRAGNKDDVYKATNIEPAINKSENANMRPKGVDEASECTDMGHDDDIKKKPGKKLLLGDKKKTPVDEAVLGETWQVKHKDGTITNFNNQRDAYKAHVASAGSTLGATHGALGRKASSALSSYTSSFKGDFDDRGYAIKPRSDKKVKEEVQTEEMKGKLAKAAKIGAVMGTLASPAAKLHDIGDAAMASDKPNAATKMMTAVSPKLKNFKKFTTAYISKANKGEDEFARQKKYTKEEHIEEGGMPASVIKHKQDLAGMSDKEFAEKHGHKTEKALRDMAARHGYGWDKSTKTGSDHYVKRVASGRRVDEEQIDELSNYTMANYMLSATDDLRKIDKKGKDKNLDDWKKMNRREHGMHRAANKIITREKKLRKALGEEQIDEVLGKKAPPSEWIHDFVHSDNPKFKGKSVKKRQQMALAAYYEKKRQANEDLAIPMLEDGKKKKKSKTCKNENEQTDTPMTFPNLNVDVNTGRNV